MARRKDLSLDKIAYLLREISENKSDGGERSCSNLDSDEKIKLSESDCEESEEKEDIIVNIPVKPDIYIVRNVKEWAPQNSYFPGRFATRNVLRQSSGPTSFAKQCECQVL
ncbi:hypothetical protein TNCV_834431 [Trichonephila clavipes]|nr:hypothetical protein TNCV_834431 [Trichonephila clavipes]